MNVNERGPTTFDLRSILQKHVNSRVTGNKMMHKTTASNYKREDIVFEIITQ